jgi:hypothetical protein
LAIGWDNTFSYVATVPGSLEPDPFPWPTRLPFPLTDPIEPERDCCMVGPSPKLMIEDAGPPPYASGPNPHVPRSRLTLTASGKDLAAASAVSFCIDRRLSLLIRLHDTLNIVRSDTCGRLGLSLIREGELVFAAGVITVVPLGERVKARIPYDLIQAAEAIFKKQDETFEFHEYPIEVNVGSEQRILYRGCRQVGGYHVSMMHGFRWGPEPGESECGALLSVGACHVAAAFFTEQLLNTKSYEIVGW